MVEEERNSFHIIYDIRLVSCLCHIYIILVSYCYTKMIIALCLPEINHVSFAFIDLLITRFKELDCPILFSGSTQRYFAPLGNKQFRRPYILRQ